MNCKAQMYKNLCSLQYSRIVYLEYLLLHSKEQKNIQLNNTGNSCFHEFTKIVQSQKHKQDNTDKIWTDSPYSEINNLKNNNVGNVGELFIQNICERNNIPCSIDGTKTKTKNIGVGSIVGKTVEIKTARIGKNHSYQHELGENPWNAEYLLFVDINPHDLYIVILKNFPKEFYENSNRKIPFFNKKICRRKEKILFGNYKLTLQKKDLLKECNFILKITTDTTDFEIKNFIERNIC